jgi:hypothetical protein
MVAILNVLKSIPIYIIIAEGFIIHVKLRKSAMEDQVILGISSAIYSPFLRVLHLCQRSKGRSTYCKSCEKKATKGSWPIRCITECKIKTNFMNATSYLIS